MNNLGLIINEMMSEKNLTQDMVLDTIRDLLKAAYKRKFGTDENVDITFSDNLNSVSISAIKTVVLEENYYNEVTEIPLDEAEELAENVEVGDSLFIPISFDSFDRGSIQTAKQRTQQNLKEIQNNYVYKEFESKVGQLIQCYVASVNSYGDIILTLGDKVHGILPVNKQSPREVYSVGDSIKCYFEDISKPEKIQGDKRGRKNERDDVRMVFSRSCPNLIKKLLEIQIPEVGDGQVKVESIARQAGFRTKLAVSTYHSDIDPVATIIGLKGNRINTIKTEIDNEIIDVILYDENPLTFIANALAPATVNKVLILDVATRQAIAIVDENQLGLAIGNQGINIKLAKKLTDWQILVKTQEEFEQMDISQEAREKAEAIFTTGYVEELAQEEVIEESGDIVEVDEGETLLSDLNISSSLVEKLNFYDIYSVEEYFELTDEDLDAYKITEEERAEINACVDIEEEEFECPNCGVKLPFGTEVCPSCHVEFEFE